MRCPVHCAAARSINAMRVPKIVFQCPHIRGASWEEGEIGKEEGWGGYCHGQRHILVFLIQI